MDWSGRKIHVKNIPKNIDSKQLKIFFSQFGSVTSCKVIETNKRKLHCYGFVGFSQKEAARAALESELVIEGNYLIAEVLSPQKAHQNLLSLVEGQEDDTYLFLPNIPKDTEKSELVKYFSSFGPLKQMKLAVKTDKETNSLYIQYKDLNSVTLAKSKRHRLLNISAKQPKLTLVCKIRVFNTAKYRKLIASAEELLLTRSRKSSNDQFTTGTKYNQTGFILTKSRMGSSILLKNNHVGSKFATKFANLPTQPASSAGLSTPEYLSDSGLSVSDDKWVEKCIDPASQAESNYRINYPSLHLHMKPTNLLPTDSSIQKLNCYTPFKPVFYRC